MSLFITKDKKTGGDSEEVVTAIKQLKDNQDNLLFRIKNIEDLCTKNFRISKKELLTNFNRVKEEIMLSSYDHDCQDLNIKIDPIIVTNE